MQTLHPTIGPTSPYDRQPRQMKDTTTEQEKVGVQMGNGLVAGLTPPEPLSPNGVDIYSMLLYTFIKIEAFIQ